MLYLRHSSYSNPSFASPTSQAFHLIHLVSCPCTTDVIFTSITLSNVQYCKPVHYFCFSCITSSSLNSLGRAHSPTFPSLHLCHNLFSNPSVALPTPQFILQPFCCFTYVTAYSPTLPSLYLHHSSFSNPSVASPT